MEIHTSTVRVSSRTNKRKEFRRQLHELWLIQEIKEPKTNTEAIKCDSKAQWLAAMQDGMESMKTNQTWELVNCPKEDSHRK